MRDVSPYSTAPCTSNHNPCHENALTNTAETPKCSNTCVKGYYNSYEYDKSYGKNYREWLNGEHDMEKKVMEEIMEYGPVSAIMDVYDDFESYKDGVYVVNPDAEKKFWHVVRIIGWGVENGVKYWHAANSFNTFWGENGFFKIRRGTNEANIETHMMAADPDINGITCIFD